MNLIDWWIDALPDRGRANQALSATGQAGTAIFSEKVNESHAAVLYPADSEAPSEVVVPVTVGTYAQGATVPVLVDPLSGKITTAMPPISLPQEAVESGAEGDESLIDETASSRVVFGDAAQATEQAQRLAAEAIAQIDIQVTAAQNEADVTRQQILDALDAAFEAEGGVEQALAEVEGLGAHLTDELATTRAAIDATATEAASAKTAAQTALATATEGAVEVGRIKGEASTWQYSAIQTLLADVAFLTQLYANQVIVAGDNLLTDPQLRAAELWLLGAGMTHTPGAGKSGGGALAVTSTGATSNAYQRTGVGYYVPVSPGSTYRLGFWYKTSATAAPQAAVGIIYYLYDAVGTVTKTATLLKGATSPVANTWQWVEGELTIPEGTARLRFGMGIRSTLAAGVTATFCDPLVQCKTDGNLIVDGAVTASHITASESLSAKIAEFIKIKASALIADSAAMNEAFVRQLVGDSAFLENLRVTNEAIVENLVGKTITGSVITGGVIDGGLVRGAEFELKTHQAPSASTIYTQAFSSNIDGWSTAKSTLPLNAKGTYTTTRVAAGGRTGGALQISVTGEYGDPSGNWLATRATIKRSPRINIPLTGKKTISAWVKASSPAHIALSVAARSPSVEVSTYLSDHRFGSNMIPANTWTKLEVVVPEGFGTEGLEADRDFKIDLYGGEGPDITYLIDDIAVTTTYYGNQQMIIRQNVGGYPELAAYGASGEQIVISTRLADGYGGLAIFPSNPQTATPIIISQEGIGRVHYQEGTQNTPWAALLAAAETPRSVNITAQCSVASGWSLPGSVIVTIQGKFCQLYCSQIIRTGAAITVPASGDLSNQTLLTIPEEYWPTNAAGMSSVANGRVATGYLSTAGALVLSAVGGSADISTGSLSLAGTYLRR